MGRTLTGHPLDPDQLSAVEIDAGTRQIVIAGPGSGKTEVVSALIERLIDQGADPGDGVLVISFSNAAVNAVGARLHGSDTGPVGVQTMDSLASAVIRDLADDDPGRLDFDGRVALATQLLQQHHWDRIEDLEHLVVDEVQDVVGLRADFLLTLLHALPDETGFTLLGDPAQGIYDFQIRTARPGPSPVSNTSSQQLLAAAGALPDVETRQLAGQYRAESRDARRAALLRPGILPGGDAREVADFYAGLVPFAGIDAAHDLVTTWQGTTVFLTATNGQALLVAGALRASGTPVEVRRSADQRVIAAWVARLLGDAPAQNLSKTEFTALVTDRTPDLDPDVGWRTLRRVAGTRGTELDLARLAGRLRSPRPLASDLIDRPAAALVVSTVHRAKGLEFDNVLLVDFAPSSRNQTTAECDDAGSADEALRTRFVALTRARRHLARVQGPDDRPLRRLHVPGLHQGRWYLGGPKPWMTFGFEIGLADVEPLPDHPAARLHLATRVTTADPLTLQLDPDRSTLAVPVYNVTHDGVAVARTSTRFGEDLAGRIGTLENKRSSWPALSGARVESVATRVVDATPGTGPGARFRLAPAITGLLTIEWENTTRHD